jgi:hypothetical protein
MDRRSMDERSASTMPRHVLEAEAEAAAAVVPVVPREGRGEAPAEEEAVPVAGVVAVTTVVVAAATVVATVVDDSLRHRHLF